MSRTAITQKFHVRWFPNETQIKIPLWVDKEKNFGGSLLHILKINYVTHMAD